MFSTSQWISMVIVAGGIVLYLVNKKGINGKEVEDGDRFVRWTNALRRS